LGSLRSEFYKGKNPAFRKKIGLDQIQRGAGTISPFQRSLEESQLNLGGMSMERRLFLKMLIIGVGAAAAAPAEALTTLMPRAPGHDPDVAPERAVASSEDLDRAQVEKAYYGHWRRVRRRVYRRGYRRAYRRHFYYRRRHFY
jgi:hypothetical protein